MDYLKIKKRLEGFLRKDHVELTTPGNGVELSFPQDGVMIVDNPDVENNILDISEEAPTDVANVIADLVHNNSQ